MKKMIVLMIGLGVRSEEHWEVAGRKRNRKPQADKRPRRF